jgi:hypothetical protein
MKYFILVLFVPFTSCTETPWGFFAHKKINKLAIFCLPPPLINLYKRHIHEIETYAVLPDQRRHSLDKEAARHYIDLDRYPIEKIKYRTWEDAASEYSADTLEKHGIVPWNITSFYQKLKYAFMNRDTIRIIKISAELGHYVADAHVPLHTTSNYDGQKTNQVGIHSFWESKIPEHLQDQLEDWIGPATYIQSPLHASWDWVLASHQLLPKLLAEEYALSKETPDSKKYTHLQKGFILDKSYLSSYVEAYHKRLDNQVETRFRESIKHIADLWYSAWIESGEPEFK